MPWDPAVKAMNAKACKNIVKAMSQIAPTIMHALTDQNGNPKLYYHGTRREFEVFLPNQIGLIHFSELRSQAQEFSCHPRGDHRLPVGEPRIICAHLFADKLFDTENREALEELADSLDWNVVVREAEELSQSPWTVEEAQRWLAQGEWQILELPAVLGEIRRNYDGMVMHELGARNVAVFSPVQVKVVGVEVLPEPGRAVKNKMF